MELEKVVTEKFNEIIESGFIENQIRTTLESTIQNLIESSMRQYSDFGKTLEEKIKEAIKIDKLELKLPEYNQLVCNWIIEIVNNAIALDCKNQIEKNIEKFFKPLEKDEYKISEIIEEFKESLLKDDDNPSEGEITFIHDESSSCKGYIDFSFDAEPNKNKYSCDYQIGINDKGLWRMEIQGENVDKMKNPILYDFDSFMFQLYTQKVKIINDAEDVEIYYSNYE